MGFRLRQEKTIDAIRSLTELSKQTTRATYVFVYLIIATGLVLGFQGGWLRSVWIWTALVLLIITMGAMNGLSRRYNAVREAAGLPRRGRRRTQPAPPASPEQLPQLAAGANPWPISVVGLVALVLLLWLMILKPF